MSRPMSVRLSARARARLVEHARQTGVTSHALAVRHIEEGLRVIDFPGVTFGDSDQGRIAKVGPWALWEVIVSVLSHYDNPHEAAEELELPDRLVWTAIDYYGQFSDEIDEHLATYGAAREAREPVGAAGFEALKRVRGRGPGR